MLEGDRPIVAKFGGSSMADERSISLVRDIVMSDPRRRFIVVSAPGVSRLFPERSREKATDLLLQGRFDEARKRFSSLGQSLGIQETVNESLEEVRGGMNGRLGENKDWVASRGEWLSGKMFAKLIDAEFIDPQTLLSINREGKFNTRSYPMVERTLAAKKGRVVIPGFYGSGHGGRVQTFPRGGSDITGSIVARAAEAQVYENWTDVDGLLRADPRIVESPGAIPEVTYEEMRELSVRGATVLQSDSVLPVYEAGIPINLRNTFQSNHAGTMIVLERTSPGAERVVGVAGRKNFTAFQIERFGMNDDVGVGAAILEAFQKQGISYQHDISGMDYTSVIVDSADLNHGEGERIREALRKEIGVNLPGAGVKVLEGLSQVSVVGQKIGDYSTEVGTQVLQTLGRADVNFKTMEFGTKGNNLVVGIGAERFEDVVRALSRTFFS